MLLPLFEQRSHRGHQQQQHENSPQTHPARSVYYLAVGVAVTFSIILCGLISGVHTTKYMMFVSLPELSFSKELNPSGLVLNWGATPRLMPEKLQGAMEEKSEKTEQEKPVYNYSGREMRQWIASLPIVNHFTPSPDPEFFRGMDCPYVGELGENLRTEGFDRANDTFEAMPDGCRKHGPTGMKIWKMSDMCIGPDRVFVVARNETEYGQLLRCCFDGEIKTEGCEASVVERCRSARSKIGGTSLKVHLVNQSDLIERNVFTLKGNSYWVATPTRTEHFGHWLNRIMQFFALTHDKTAPPLPKLDRLVTRQNRPVSSHLKTVASTVLGPLWDSSIYNEEIKEKPFEMVCMERSIEIAAGQLETTIFTDNQGELWRKFSRENFGKFGYLNVDSCPPPKAVVLQRTEGTGRRMILNYDVVDRVLGRMGIPYTNISLSGEDGSDRQIGLFNDFGLMISSHSSQLKNLLWAARNAVVLETRGTPPGYMQPSPFAMGMDGLDVIFHESVGHIPNYASCPEPHGCREVKMYKVDYWLNETIFEESVKRALGIQRERCGRATQWR
eukprot:comp23097_c0_seq1/m.37105 comp23097_c0_seq1/g.37105  ORF comp23097_c0_seq1/g.37105 comp23097_c0_seq1/m.37105 type:complete len:558 (-) comp23097_c0_seq1:29-1702(-)